MASVVGICPAEQLAIAYISAVISLFVAVGEAEEWSYVAARSWNSAHHSPEQLQKAAEQAQQQSYADTTFMYERLLELEVHTQQQRLQL